ncbi:MAG: hypothetical protein QM718_13685 [Steroidobacteraceae bacterium]
MKDVYLVGTAQSPVTMHGEPHLSQMGADVVLRAIADARIDPARVGSLHIGNMMAGTLSNQQQLGSLIADYCGLAGMEASCSEAACASGAVAIREGYLRVRAGCSDAVVVCGVEIMTAAPAADVTRALAAATDWDLEGSVGETFVSLNAALMRSYVQRHGVDDGCFAGFSLTAHRNALTNPNAALRKQVDRNEYLGSRMIAEPLRLFDISPICNGAAAIVLASEGIAREAARSGRPMIRVAASAAATDAPAIAHRADPLQLRAVTVSTQRALEQARIERHSIDLFELHDAYTIMTALILEAAGFAAPGAGTSYATDAASGLNGELPVSTFGGLKARGHPVGATGVYQFVESCQQLAGTAGANQVPGATVAMTQNIGGIASTVVTHLLVREG